VADALTTPLMVSLAQAVYGGADGRRGPTGSGSGSDGDRGVGDGGRGDTDGGRGDGARQGVRSSPAAQMPWWM
jgi:hypothetical protein